MKAIGWSIVATIVLASISLILFLIPVLRGFAPVVLIPGLILLIFLQSLYPNHNLNDVTAIALSLFGVFMILVPFRFVHLFYIHHYVPVSLKQRNTAEQDAAANP